MNGPCSQCAHYRRVKPISQIAAGTVDANDAAVSDALAKIVEDERKRREAEAQYKTTANSLGQDTWHGRPLMSDFCGLREQDEQFFIAEIKNAGQRCEDFTPGAAPRRSCADCRHRVVPDGRTEDQLVEQVTNDMSRTNIILGLPTTLPDAMLTKHRDGVPARIAFEISGAYSANGRLWMTPKYLDHCAHFSTDGAHAICLMQNLHETCPAWQAAATAPAAEPDATAPAGSPAVPVQSRPDATAVLVTGPPPLTRADVDGYVAFLGWILDLRHLPDALVAQIQQTLIDGWDTRDSRAVWLQNIAFLRQVQAADPATRTWLRESNQAVVVASMRGSSHPVNTQLIALYDQANPALAAGPPPLTAETADAFYDLTSFQQAVVRGSTPHPVSAAERAPQRVDLAAIYDDLPATQRDIIASAPMDLAQLRIEWAHMSQEQRAVRRGEWASTWESAAPPPAPRYAEPQSASAATVDELVGNILRAQEQSEAEAAKIDPALAAQVKLQNMQANAQMLSSMVKARHEASMAIINNMR